MSSLRHLITGVVLLIIRQSAVPAHLLSKPVRGLEMTSKAKEQRDQEIHDLIMSLPQKPEAARKVLPPPPKTLEDAKTMDEIEAYLQSLNR